MTERVLVESFSELLPQIMHGRWGKVPMEIAKYLDGGPQSAVLKSVIISAGKASSLDEVVTAFEKILAASKASRE